MPFKKDEKGNFVIKEQGHHIFVDEPGTEKAYDVAAQVRQMAEYAKQATQRGQELAKLEARYRELDDVADISAFLKKAKAERKRIETARMAYKNFDRSLSQKS